MLYSNMKKYIKTILERKDLLSEQTTLENELFSLHSERCSGTPSTGEGFPSEERIAYLEGRMAEIDSRLKWLRHKVLNRRAQHYPLRLLDWMIETSMYMVFFVVKVR